MDLVVDANILFAALIKQEHTAHLFVEDSLNLFSPNFLFEEMQKYYDFLLSKTYRTREDLSKFFWIIQRKIKVIPKKIYIEFLDQANKLSPDPKDVLYFALALSLECPIWSNDRRLKNQDTVIVYNTTDVLQKIQEF